MRASNFEKVAAALASLKNPRRRSGRRGVGEDAAAFDNGEEITMKVRITADQARVLRGSGMDIEALAQAGAEKALKEAEVRAWKEANHEALEASNRWIEKHGTLAEQLGLI